MIFVLSRNLNWVAQVNASSSISWFGLIMKSAWWIGNEILTINHFSSINSLRNDLILNLRISNSKNLTTFDLNKIDFPNFYFSRVKSYTAQSDLPIRWWTIIRQKLTQDNLDRPFIPQSFIFLSALLLSINRLLLNGKVSSGNDGFF